MTSWRNKIEERAFSEMERGLVKVRTGTVEGPCDCRQYASLWTSVSSHTA